METTIMGLGFSVGSKVLECSFRALFGLSGVEFTVQEQECAA